MGKASRQKRHVKIVVEYLNSIKTFVATMTKSHGGHWKISMEFEGKKKEIYPPSTPKVLYRTQRETLAEVRRTLEELGIKKPRPVNAFTLSKPSIHTNALGQPIEDVWKLISDWEKSIEEGEQEEGQ